MMAVVCAALVGLCIAVASSTMTRRVEAKSSMTEASQPISLPFVQVLRQTGRNGKPNDSYGYAVAADDDTIVIGAPLANVNNKARHGAVFVFVRTGNDWAMQHQIFAKDGEAEARFGSSVAISGDTIVIGAPYDKIGENSYQGSVQVFTRSGSGWTFQQKLTAPDGEAQDQFGASVGISGHTIVVGAFGDNAGVKSDQGSAHVFVRSVHDWSHQKKLTANDGEANDQFGASVAISGQTIVVGSILDDLGTNQNTGSAYVFVRSGIAWTQQQRLVANIARSNDLFGASVAISGETAIIGAPLADPYGTVDQGMAYIFVRSNGVWSLQLGLVANDGATGDQFGSSVAIDGDTALVGAHFDDIGTAAGTESDQGSAYLFSRTTVSWAPRQRLTAEGGAAREMFGQAVALSGNVAVAGAPHAKIGENLSQGAIYLFGCGYARQQTLTGNESEPFDGFGAAIDVDGDTLVVGSPGDDVGKNEGQGSAYVFVRTPTGWMQQARLLAFDGAAYDQFGRSVAISGDIIVVGAPFTSVFGKPKQGAAYIFVRSGGTWSLKGRPFGDPTGGLYGWSVAIDGDLIAVGAPSDEVGQNQYQGSVTIFNLSKSNTTGSLEQVMTANDGEAFDQFGFSVSLSGNRLLVGAIGPNDGERNKGAAYVFDRSSAQSQPWKESAKLLANDGELLDRFGNSVALSGNTALISAPGKVSHNPLRRQIAYVFVTAGAPGNVWTQQARLILGEGYPYGSLAVALSGNTAVIGTGSEYVDGRMNQGTVRVFKRSGTTWTTRQQIVAGDGRTGDNFGHSVAITGDTLLAGATNGGSVRQGSVYTLKTSCVEPLAPFTTVSAASFAAAGGLAPESIAVGFGANLATEMMSATTFPLPTTLAGVRLIVRDSAGVERQAPLFFVSPWQINYLIPSGTAAGNAVITVVGPAGPVASGTLGIAGVAPGLFSANSSGQGIAAANILRVKAGGSQVYEPVARFDSQQNRFVPIPIELGSSADQVYLVLYGTGLRNRSSLSAVNCSIGGVNSETLYAGAVPGLVGFDQINLRLPRSLAGRGEIEVTLSVDNRAANTVRLSVR